MELLLVLPLFAFLILLTLFLLVLRRAGRFIARTRDVERFRRQVRDLAGRIERSLGEICARVDELRRGQLGADALADDLSASLDAVGRYADEARGLRPPRAHRAQSSNLLIVNGTLYVIDAGDGITRRLAKAGIDIREEGELRFEIRDNGRGFESTWKAPGAGLGNMAEMIEHGRSIQASARSGGREVEAQTSIKRGYLNVLHAREAINHQAELARVVGVRDDAGLERPLP